jgi:hypothetical protein
MSRVGWLPIVLLVMAVGCRGIATSSGQPTPVPNFASSARVTESTVPKVVIDRECSKLGDAADEYVCVTSQESDITDMSSWVLRNVLGRSFSFPPGFKLPPGQTIKVHTKAGANAAAELHWGYSVNPAWERGDKLTLLNGENVQIFVSEPAR